MSDIRLSKQSAALLNKVFSVFEIVPWQSNERQIITKKKIEVKLRYIDLIFLIAFVIAELPFAEILSTYTFSQESFPLEKSASKNSEVQQ